MLSPKVRQTIESIGPLLSPSVASAISGRAAAQPRGVMSLGRLDQIVVHYGLIRGQAQPVLRRKALLAFAADHGIASEAPAVQMEATPLTVRQLLRGGSAAAVMCRRAGIETSLINMGTVGAEDLGELSFSLGQGSANMIRCSAMTQEQLDAALEIGIRLAADAASRFDVVGVTQLGAGGNLAAAALLSSQSGRPADEVTLRDPADTEADFLQRTQVVRTALNRHQQDTISAVNSLRTMGGLDLAAITGFLLGAATHRLPVVVDGFAAGSAALMARALAPDSLDTMIFSHCMPASPHAYLLKFMQVEPLLDMQIREPGGFGAALAIQTLETALGLFDGIRDLSGNA